MLHGDATFSIPDGDDMMEFCVPAGRRARRGSRTEAQAMVDDAAGARRAAARSTAGSTASPCAPTTASTPARSSARASSTSSSRPTWRDLIRGLPRHGLLRHQAHRRQHHADPRPARAGAARTPCTPSTRRAAWTSPRSSGAYGDQVCLIGNVNCGLLDTGTDERGASSPPATPCSTACPAAATSSPPATASTPACACAATRLMLDVWRKEGNYPDGGQDT